MKRLVTILAILGSAHGLAFADAKGMDYLGKVDKQLNNFTDGVFESKLRVKTADGSWREYGFTTYQKVPARRLGRFTAPGDVKGMGVLVENAETMYVFLPGFQRVRRMGTHIKNQTFMGSDFGFEDMSQTSFSPTFDPKVVAEDDKTITLELNAKSGKDLEFPKMRMTV